VNRKLQLGRCPKAGEFFYYRSINQSHTVLARADSASKVGGAISVIVGCQVSSRLRYNTAVTKQWTTKWPYVANAVFRIVTKLGE